MAILATFSARYLTKDRTMNLLARLIVSGALCAPMVANAASLGGYPADATCADERNESFAQGFAAGDENGFNRGYQVGFGEGSAAQIAACVANPQGCGITLASCIPDATYGETEPNDSLITADPLTLGVAFWGQNYSGADQDWFYTETSAANQNIVLSFAVPDWIEGADLASGVPATWNVSVRDAAGNVFANFNTNVVGGIEATTNAVTYSVTLGLAGTYYVVVKPVSNSEDNAYSYSVTAFLQDTNLDNNQGVAGFYDSEVEPNNKPSHATPLATGVSMYGLINLTFDGTYLSDPENDIYKWGQGEDDWFVYKSDGNEIVTLAFCVKEECGPGDWFVEVYDQASAQALENGVSETTVTPLLAFNTNLYQCFEEDDEPQFCIDDDHPGEPQTYRIGLRDPGYYFMRVDHMRLFTAPCVARNFVSSDGSGYARSCTCSDGSNECYIPTDECSEGDIVCVNRVSDSACITGVEPGCNERCETVTEGEEQTEQCTYWYTDALCTCSQYGGVVALPAVYTSPYNFTWHATQLPTNTIDTDVYEDFLNRSSPY